MSDLISRQQAIDALLGITAMRNTIPLDSAIFNIKKLPSAQPERRWMPVTEILPENDDKVLITHSHGVSMAWWNGRYWTGSMIKKYKTVTAWMPLPEPYQEGEQE